MIGPMLFCFDSEKNEIYLKIQNCFKKTKILYFWRELLFLKIER